MNIGEFLLYVVAVIIMIATPRPVNVTGKQVLD